MNMQKKELSELNALIELALDDSISPEQSGRLNDLIIHDTAVCKYYCEYIHLTVDLERQSIKVPATDLQEYTEVFNQDLWNQLAYEEKTAPMIELPTEEPKQELIQKVVYPPREKKKISKFNIFTLVVSAAAMLFMVLFVTFAPDKTGGIEVATLVDQVNAQWGNSESGETLQAGSRLLSQIGPLWLKKGNVKIEFDYGAEVIVQGPAEFELIDAEKMALNSGRLYATVPKRATGFTAVTPSAMIIDLGTEFGVKVDFDGNSGVHMFKGKASLIPGQGGRKGAGISLAVGGAKSVDMQGEVKAIDLNAKAFVQPAQYELISKADKGSAYHRWVLYSNQLRQDPSLVAYYTFEKNEKRPDLLENKAASTQGKLDGNLQSAINAELPTWTTGRWPNKTALHLDRLNRQVVVVPRDPALHINGPVTIAAWVRCSRPEDGGHIVACREPDGQANYQLGYKAHDIESGWQGKILFGRMSGGANDERLEKTRIFGDKVCRESPEWRFIAATHNNQEAVFYVDGRYSETHDLNFQQEPVNADLIIGADNVLQDGSRFTGEIGELMIFNRVLSEREISEMHKNGQP